jgi:hypothetical protein
MPLKDDLRDSSVSGFIIIPAHNRRDITLRCLERLQAQGDLDAYSVIVIDDGSTDGTVAAVAAQYPSVTLLHGDGNLWWTGAIELGMRHAHKHGATHIIWLNDDCLVPANTLNNLVQFTRQNTSSIIGAQGYRDTSRRELVFGGKHLHKGYYQLFECPQGTIVPCDMLSGNLVCLPIEVVEAIGFPKVILPHYGGDTLYLIQARQAGFSLYVDGRTSPIDMPAQSALNPDSWMLQSGSPLKLIQLIFQPESILSWKVWWVLLTTEHGFKGIILFGIKYLSLAPKIFIFTALRLLPLTARRNIMDAKAYLINAISPKAEKI